MESDSLEGNTEKNDKFEWAQSLVLDQGVRLVRAGTFGQREGAMAGGLALCALSAGSAAESLPFAKKWMAACGDPGWMLSKIAIDADSAVCLEALAGLGCIDPVGELVWSGYGDENGVPSRDLDCAQSAVKAGSVKCLEWLVDHAGAGGDLLERSAMERREEALASMIARFGSDRKKLGDALVLACSHAAGRSDYEKLDAAGVLGLLDSAGADWSHAMASQPRSWATWNGGRDNQSRSVWMPSLRLADEGEALPAGCSEAGEAESSVFLGGWSAGEQLARSALEEGARGEGEKALRRFYGKWELAKAPGSLCAPIALLALGDPARTDSGLRRELMDSAKVILESPLLDVALADASVFGLAKSAVGGWLWGRTHDEGKVAWRRRPDPLTLGLAKRCEALGLRPLGERSSREAATRFVEALSCFDSGRLGSVAKAKARRDMIEESKLDDPRDPDGEWSKLGVALASWRDEMAEERRCAEALALLMDARVGARLVEAVDLATRATLDPNPGRLAAAKERAVLAMGAAMPESRGPTAQRL